MGLVFHQRRPQEGLGDDSSNIEKRDPKEAHNRYIALAKGLKPDQKHQWMFNLDPFATPVISWIENHKTLEWGSNIETFEDGSTQERVSKV